MICAAQQEVPASEKYHKTYDPQIQMIISWDETMTIPLDSTNVMDVMNANMPLPEGEKRLENKIITDIMREARNK